MKIFFLAIALQALAAIPAHAEVGQRPMPLLERVPYQSPPYIPPYVTQPYATQPIQPELIEFNAGSGSNSAPTLYLQQPPAINASGALMNTDTTSGDAGSFYYDPYGNLILR